MVCAQVHDVAVQHLQQGPLAPVQGNSKTPASTTDAGRTMPALGTKPGGNGARCKGQRPRPDGVMDKHILVNANNWLLHTQRQACKPAMS
jgi:hypothetical protein